MTDLEITKLCAEAMGLLVGESGYALLGHMENHPYDPLHDDAQAMALVRKFGLCVRRIFDEQKNELSGPWRAYYGGETYIESQHAEHADLNRAICECVAKMQLAKAKP